MDYEQNKSMAMRDMYIDSDGIFFSNYTFNALIFMDKISGVCQFVSSFDGAISGEVVQHKRIIRYNENLFFFPEWAQGISKYNLVTKKMEFYKSTERYIELTDVIVYDQNAYLIPKSIKQPIYIFDMEKCCYIDKSDWNKRIINEIDKNEELQFATVCAIGKSLWIHVRNTNMLIETIIDNWEYVIHYIEDDFLIHYITSDGKNLWMSSKINDAVACWNKDKGFLSRYVLSIYRNNGITKDMAYLKCVQEKILILPENGSELFIINLDGRIDKIVIPHINRVHDDGRKAMCWFGGCVVYDRAAYLLPWAADKLYKVNIDTYNITEYSVMFTDIECYFRNVILISEVWKDIIPIVESKGYYQDKKDKHMHLLDYIYCVKTGLWEKRGKKESHLGYDIYMSIK